MGRAAPRHNRDVILRSRNEVGFAIGSYDARLPLTIDPVLVYSTFLGGAGSDQGFAIAVDSAGNAYVTGSTTAAFPTTAGAFDTSLNGSFDAFVTKFNAAGTAIVYSTVLGGSRSDVGSGIVVDGSGNAYIVGRTGADFPTTAGAFDTSPNGDVDTFVVKLNATGSALVYSTYLGGSGSEFLTLNKGIAVDAAGNAHVVGATNSANFPATAGAFDTSFNGGSDGYVTKLNADGSALVYSTFLGGSRDDVATGIALDASGNTYVTGWTDSNLVPSFPTTPGAFDTFISGHDAFVTKLDPTGSTLVYSTFLGGSNTEALSEPVIAVDGAGQAYVAGGTASANSHDC